MKMKTTSSWMSIGLIWLVLAWMVISVNGLPYIPTTTRLSRKKAKEYCISIGSDLFDLEKDGSGDGSRRLIPFAFVQPNGLEGTSHPYAREIFFTEGKGISLYETSPIFAEARKAFTMEQFAIQRPRMIRKYGVNPSQLYLIKQMIYPGVDYMGNKIDILSSQIEESHPFICRDKGTLDASKGEISESYQMLQCPVAMVEDGGIGEKLPIISNFKMRKEDAQSYCAIYQSKVQLLGEKVLGKKFVPFTYKTPQSRKEGIYWIRTNDTELQLMDDFGNLETTIALSDKNNLFYTICEQCGLPHVSKDGKSVMNGQTGENIMTGEIVPGYIPERKMLENSWEKVDWQKVRWEHIRRASYFFDMAQEIEEPELPQLLREQLFSCAIQCNSTIEYLRQGQITSMMDCPCFASTFNSMNSDAFMFDSHLWALRAMAAAVKSTRMPCDEIFACEHIGSTSSNCFWDSNTNMSILLGSLQEGLAYPSRYIKDPRRCSDKPSLRIYILNSNNVANAELGSNRTLLRTNVQSRPPSVALKLSTFCSTLTTCGDILGSGHCGWCFIASSQMIGSNKTSRALRGNLFGPIVSTQKLAFTQMQPQHLKVRCDAWISHISSCRDPLTINRLHIPYLEILNATTSPSVP